MHNTLWNYIVLFVKGFRVYGLIPHCPIQWFYSLDILLLMWDAYSLSVFNFSWLTHRMVSWLPPLHVLEPKEITTATRSNFSLYVMGLSNKGYICEVKQIYILPVTFIYHKHAIKRKILLLWWFCVVPSPVCNQESILWLSLLMLNTEREWLPHFKFEGLERLRVL